MSTTFLRYIVLQLMIYFERMLSIIEKSLHSISKKSEPQSFPLFINSSFLNLPFHHNDYKV